MADELKPLSLLFQNRLFRIPDYQRGYAWQTQQLVDFWDDLNNLQNGRYHYTGLLSLKMLKSDEIRSWGKDVWIVDKGFKPCHIVDGQQRLTTFVILLNVLVCFVRNLEENSGKSDSDIVLGYETLTEIVAKYICQRRPPQNIITTYLFGYETDNPSDQYLRHRIFDEPFYGEVSETYYTKNLQVAKDFFEENVDALYKEEGLEGINNIYIKLTQRLMFNLHEINDDYDVFVAFETMNNRGKPLTNLELLKNRLIYLTTIYNDVQFDETDKKELRAQINDAWKEIYYQLGRNRTRPLSDDDFLREHWIIYFTYTRQRGDDYIRYLLNKFSAKNVFEKKPVVVESEQEAVPDEMFDEDEESEEFVEEPVEQFSSKLEPKEIANYVNSLKDLAKYWYDTYFPYESTTLTKDEQLWIDRINRIGIGYFRPLVTVAISKSKNETILVNLFKAIERFIFIAFRIGMARSNYQSTVYYAAARDIYNGSSTIAEVTQNLGNASDNFIQYALNAFTNDIEKRFKTGRNEGYYTWNSLRYFMFEYEYSLMESTGIKKISWEFFSKFEKDKVSIEHILPQTPTKWYWRNQFRQFISDKDEMARLTGALGNLLPLSQSINSSLQNDSFEEKKNPNGTGRRGYTTGSNSEIEVSRKANWDAVTIHERTIHLLDFMESRWNIPMTEEQKTALAFDSFINDGRDIQPEIPQSQAEEVIEVLTTSDLSAIKLRYWEYALPIIRAAQGEDGGSYSNVVPSEDGNRDGHFGISWLRPYCDIRIRPVHCKAGIWIDSDNREKSKAIFDVLYAHKAEIEAKVSMPLEWDRKDNKDAASICFVLYDVDFRNVENWKTISDFHSKMLKELSDYVFRPYEQEIRNLDSGWN